ncbi:MAG: ferredoxin--NADP+ reductase [Myxococcota bacterium]|jgi:ferredoxin--NADP+ reductase
MHTPERPLRVAVIGAGPSGFYTVAALFKQSVVPVSVALIDRLPTPFGLVRAGVAPDHQKIKNVVRKYDSLAADPRFMYLGNVTLGVDLEVHELRERFDAIVYAVGAEADRKLWVPGEDLAGVSSATDFVYWYNAHPDHTQHGFDLSGVKRAVVVGNGNVAVDIARVLGCPADAFRSTDIADYALEALACSAVEEVVVLGRRGPAQAAFHPKEVRELAACAVDVVVDPAVLELDDATRAWLDGGGGDRATRKTLEVLEEIAHRPLTGARRIVLEFCKSPVALYGAGGALAQVEVAHNRLELRDGSPRPVDTGVRSRFSTQALFRAIGYRGVEIPGVPFEPRRGIIRNDGGRVVDADGAVRAGEYVVGWAKRGPSGVIGTNAADAVDTVGRLLEDVADLTPGGSDGDLRELLDARGVRWLDYAGWRRIDSVELRDGAQQGRVRAKMVDIGAMIDVARDDP